MSYYLGIDGGGTKTAVIVIDHHQHVIKHEIFGPTSIDTIDLDTFKQTFNAFFDQLNFDLDGIYAGIGGILSQEDAIPIKNILEKMPHVTRSTHIIVDNDIKNAYFSGGFINEGLALIIGTGSVCYGKNHELSHRAGGWGFLEGDLGSAYDLGLTALLQSIKAFDGRIDDTSFYQNIRNSYGLLNAHDIFHSLEDIRLNRTKTASFSKLITNEAKKGDPTAIELIQQSCKYHVQAIQAVMKKIQLKKTTCVVVGSLGHDPYYFQALQNELLDNQINISVIKPIFSPELAAAKYIQTCK